MLVGMGIFGAKYLFPSSDSIWIAYNAIDELGNTFATPSGTREPLKNDSGN